MVDTNEWLSQFSGGLQKVFRNAGILSDDVLLEHYNNVDRFGCRMLGKFRGVGKARFAEAEDYLIRSGYLGTEVPKGEKIPRPRRVQAPRRGQRPVKTIVERLQAVRDELLNIRGLILSDSEQVVLTNAVEIHRAIQAAVIETSCALYDRVLSAYHRHTDQCYDAGATENTPVCGQAETWPDQKTFRAVGETPCGRAYDNQEGVE